MLANQNPRYLVKRGIEYPFLEMAAVAENFGGILKWDWRRLESSGLARFKPNDTLFAKITPCPENGKVAFVSGMPGETGLGSTEFIVLSPRDGTDPRFLYHLACAHDVRGRAAARMEGSTGRQRVPEDVFDRRLLVPRPAPHEQTAIAHVLDAVDAAIDRARETSQSALKLRAALLADLLSVGVGDDGKLRALDSRQSGFVRTALGFLPEAWRVSDVGTEFDIQSGVTLNEAQRSDQRLWRYLRVANVQRDALLLNDVQMLRARDPEISIRLLQAGDLLVVEGHADRRQIGRCALATDDAVGMTFQNHLFRLRSRNGMLPEFGCLWLNSRYAQKYWNAMCATSSGLNTINQRMLRRLRLGVPSCREQARIVAISEASKSHISELGKKLAALEGLKRSLMHDLLTGTVRVNSAPL
ncbi:hypothetical protein [Bradyrhizobium sp. SZCCHNS3002]|uniref:restriction endonuclease subunit S n=1 Tax=Bradyrhizobium sp. SZCCHNS3002 TaxID=3057310 RepID=UPI0028E9471A|nr:hypothetical protein [Bradyrhizobium sp. SZCCHNS3002]